MKKKVLGLALAAIFSFGVSSFAQSADNASTGADKTCVKKDKKECGKKCDKKAGEKCDKKCFNPFEGLNLTEQQQNALSNVPNPRQVMKAARENGKDQKESPEMRRDVARNVMLDYLKQVKGILTPDQYVQFLENSYVNGQLSKGNKPGKGKMDGRGGKDKKFKGDRKGDRRENRGDNDRRR